MLEGTRNCEREREQTRDSEAKGVKRENGWQSRDSQHVCMYVCVCMYLCVFVSAFIRVCICVCVCAAVCACAFTYVCTCWVIALLTSNPCVLQCAAVCHDVLQCVAVVALCC